MGMKVGRGSFVNSCIALVLSKRGLLGTVDNKKNPRAQRAAPKYSSRTSREHSPAFPLNPRSCTQVVPKAIASEDGGLQDAPKPHSFQDF